MMDGRNLVIPTALDIVQNESLTGQLAGKVTVITGASSGFGLETARAILTTGSFVVLAVRNEAKAKTALSQEIAKFGHQISFVQMDNSSLSSVRSAAKVILSITKNQINILINNAGVMGIEPRQLTKDGFEVHFMTNYLSHFLLFQLLKPALLGSSQPGFNSRLVNVSSSSMRSCELLQSGNHNFENGNYTHEQAYANSKLALVYMANEVDRRYGDMGLHATSVHPGGAATGIGRNASPQAIEKIMSNPGLLAMLRSAEQGAATILVAAIAKEWEAKGGVYLEDCRESKRGEDDWDPFGSGYVKQTYDPQNEARLWEDSLQLVK